eukprot:CAMPEP_0172923100 /NCGR_PEP_ID=MMETSP1075-20121228/209137_1 /TAXON_ID=2916 /ORGANISM="Ceratium fusus, Strain PA161109" /LENGTH=66 /DNA_ID=CAMNT_0013783525 /DNA_START=1 /DNA_END=201 /DNA_ORIENTATION=-
MDPKDFQIPVQAKEAQDSRDLQTPVQTQQANGKPVNSQFMSQSSTRKRRNRRRSAGNDMNAKAAAS